MIGTNTIKIINIYGQFNEGSTAGTGHYFTYPLKEKQRESEWKRKVLDPRDVYNKKAEYVLWTTEEGYWVSFVKKSELSGRAGKFYCSFCFGNARPKGWDDEIAGSLENIVDKIIEKKTSEISDGEIENILEDCSSIKLVSYINKVEIPHKNKDKGETKSAIRNYKDENGLSLIMTELKQPKYPEYARIYVGKEVEKGNSEDLTKEPIKKVYVIECEESKNTSVENEKKVEVKEGYEGDKVNLRYTKKGYLTKTVTYLIGDRDKCISSLEGGICKVKSATNAGIKFNKELTIKLVSKKNNSDITDAIVKINNKTIKHDHNKDGYFTEIEDGIENIIKVSIEHKDYENKTDNISISSLHSEDTKEYVLNPKEVEIIIKFRTTTEDTLYKDSYGNKIEEGGKRKVEIEANDKQHAINLIKNSSHDNDKSTNKSNIWGNIWSILKNCYIYIIGVAIIIVGIFLVYNYIYPMLTQGKREKEDKNYLTTSTIWNFSELKTEKYKEIYGYLSSINVYDKIPSLKELDNTILNECCEILTECEDDNNWKGKAKECVGDMYNEQTIDLQKLKASLTNLQNEKQREEDEKKYEKEDAEYLSDKMIWTKKDLKSEKYKKYFDSIRTNPKNIFKTKDKDKEIKNKILEECCSDWKQIKETDKENVSKKIKEILQKKKDTIKLDEVKEVINKHQSDKQKK
ncbi:MAG TPA: hypothetical protein DDY68_03270 [Porphyromonadaceae bacterium]|nr:hypothetical protein [Porphyromonadaceae bacterium]